MNEQFYFRKKQLSWALGLIFFFFPGMFQQLFAQQPAYFILGEEQFKGVQIYDIIQDNNHNYWISTDEGIYLYDFYSYKKVEADNAKSNAVFHFVKTANGTIYCHNIVNQVFRIKDKKCSLFYEIPEKEAINNVQLETTDKGNLVIVSKGIAIIDPKGKEIMSYHNSMESLLLINKFDDGSIHFKMKAPNEMLVLKNAAFLVKTIRNYPKDLDLQFLSNNSYAYGINNTENRCFKYDYKNCALQKVNSGYKSSTNELVRFYPTAGNIWAASATTGVRLFSDSFHPKFPDLLYKDYFISEIYVDHEGNTLLGTFDNGIVVIPDLNVPGVIPPYTNNEVLALYSDKELGLVFGTNQGEIYTRKNGVYHDLISPSDLNHNGIEGIYGNGKTPFFVFGNKTIRAFFKDSKQQVKIIDASLKDIEFISNNQFYLATNRGLFLVKLRGGTSFECSLVNNVNYRIYSLAYDELTSSLYISSAKGLLRLKANKLETVKYQNQELFIDDFYVVDGIVCAASRKFGIIKFKNNQISGVIRPMINGELEAVSKFEFSDHYLFAATDNGFFQFSEDGELINSLHTSNSFASKRVFDFTIDHNNLWVSHFGGVQRLNVNYKLPESKSVQLYISKIMVNNEEVKSIREIDNKQEKIQFFLSLPTLRNRKNAHYYYKLEGYDEFWQVAPYEENAITYNALSPGDYKLNVRYENAGRNSKTIHYSFSISRPFYSTWWFLVLCILIILVVVYLVYRRIKTLEANNGNQLKHSFEQKIRSIQWQLDPSQLAKALQTVNDLTLKGKMDNSLKFAELFTELSNRYLSQINNDFIALQDEITNLTVFLELEKIKDPTFDFSIQSTANGRTEIPRFVVQPFLEELMQKEFRGKNGPKKLTVLFSDSNGLQIVFDHNVIGNSSVESSYGETFETIHRQIQSQNLSLNGNLTYSVATSKIEDFISSAKLILSVPTHLKN